MSDSSEINSVDLQNNENNVKLACHEIGEPEIKREKLIYNTALAFVRVQFSNQPRQRRHVFVFFQSVLFPFCIPKL